MVMDRSTEQLLQSSVGHWSHEPTWALCYVLHSITKTSKASIPVVRIYGLYAALYNLEMKAYLSGVNDPHQIKWLELFCRCLQLQTNTKLVLSIVVHFNLTAANQSDCQMTNISISSLFEINLKVHLYLKNHTNLLWLTFSNNNDITMRPQMTIILKPCIVRFLGEAVPRVTL